MAFDDKELSGYDGQPCALYQFFRKSVGVNLYWFYTNADQDITYLGNVYKAVAISDGGIVQSGEASSTEFDVTMPITEAFPQHFGGSGQVPSDEIILTVRRVHFNDVDVEAPVVWVGTVSQFTQTDEVGCQIKCATMAASMKTGGLRLSWTRMCPHALYDKRCKVNPNDFRLIGECYSFTSDALSVHEFDNGIDDYLRGGFIDWVGPSGATERRGVISHGGDTIRVDGYLLGVIAGTVIRGYAGCFRTAKVCRDKFDNEKNYGGYILQPGKNPFSGEAVF